MVTEQAWDMHNSGVHAQCKPANGKKVGSGSPRACRYAGKVERIHAHDFDGPLVCGCVDTANEYIS